MKPIIKGNLIQRDSLSDLADFSPKVADNFSVEIELCIGSDSSEYSNIFWLRICTAEWLGEEVIKNGKPLLARGILVVENFSFDSVHSRVCEIVHSIDADNWDELVLKLSRYFSWEFE
jgi:hypothetical protein